MILIRPRHAFSLLRPPTRSFCTSALLASGHSRWAKIKHDKAKADVSLSKRNTLLSRELTRLTLTHGPDPLLNPSLAQAIASAKKQGYPKPSIEAAIARGQGKTAAGVPLHNITIEAMFPGGVAAIIECQTDNKIRTVADMRHLVGKFGGRGDVATSHLFERRGRLILRYPQGGGGGGMALTEEEVFDHAIEAGATDVEVLNGEEEEEGKVEILTEPEGTTTAAETLKQSLGLEAEVVEIVWIPKEETAVEHPQAQALEQLIEKIEEDPSVQDIYLNTKG